MERDIQYITSDLLSMADKADDHRFLGRKDTCTVAGVNDGALIEEGKKLLRQEGLPASEFPPIDHLCGPH